MGRKKPESQPVQSRSSGSAASARPPPGALALSPAYLMGCGAITVVVVALVMITRSPFTSASSGVRPLVSVITPTSAARHEFHSRLYDCFAAQTYEPKELVVFDDAPHASPFFTALIPRLEQSATAGSGKSSINVKYIHKPNSGFSIGRKRNQLISKYSSGEVIAHFDDDDYYAPAYLDRMVSRLMTATTQRGGGGSGEVGLTKLSGWYMYSRASQFFGYWNQTTDSALLGGQPIPGAGGGGKSQYETGRPVTIHLRRGLAMLREMVFPIDDGALWGYGFSYVYRKSWWSASGKFPDKSQSEDIDLINASRQKNGGGVTGLDHFTDTEALVLKFTHSQASSSAVSQYKLPLCAIRQIFGPRIDQYIAGAPN